MSTHTPGPWRTSRDRDEVVVHAGKFDYLPACTKGGPLEEWQANARLIAAAPDLLAALKALVEDYEGACGDDGHDTPTALMQARVAIAKASHADTNKIARAAIAKAEGTS